ncbi:MAG TPA: LysR family transcriptional regulator [Acidiphilium sp.]|nr:MAG: LysR family transcriptional regulator [Acidiphilium sp. 21-60-14]OYV89517.1 MAG: LysR family transcriptional regulator [Acidiphilium sp. 37-60-79]OZB39660.1 MAG: LysR family transcriptional regulator [Acidiphilium sp. 34-60-192]HQT87468.1 LysR family transcriptional regulator [Acidiphilium sp.]HQU24842.1 LysR family transcriptional regulator [Acidiphilium sp.]
MELTQVRYFVTLSRTLNFTRAAEMHHVSQPALTRAVQRLEEELGGPLLYRERTLTRLTELGRSMLPHLQAMLDAADNAINLAAARRTQPRCSLKIGLGPGISASVIAALIRDVAAALPKLTVSFEENDALRITELMLADDLDCALLPGDWAMPERLNRWPLYQDRAAVFLPDRHELSQMQSLGASDLGGETILIGDRCGGFGVRLIETTGQEFRQFRCGGTAAHVLELVGAGLGVAILSERITLPEALTKCALNQPLLERPVHLASVAGRPQGPAVSGFIKLCRAQRV